MKKIKLGQKAICKSCGYEIFWAGEYWDHTGVRPRHVGEPKEENENDPKDAQESEEKA